MIKSRGIPSEESFWLPAYYGTDIRQFQDNNDNPTRNIWPIDELVKFIFPKKYQEKYYEIAVAFLILMRSKNGSVEGSDIGPFLKERNISKATFYNRVLPRLKRVGIIRVKRDTLEGSDKKYRPMRVELSKTFGNYLLKIAESWLAHMDDIRTQNGGKE